MPLSILQQRQLNVILVDLCSTMDLVAIVTNEQVLSIYRTISWERVLSKSCTELNFDQVTTIKFSPDGKHIAVGFVSLNHIVITLESNDVQISQMGKGWNTAKHVKNLWWLNRDGQQDKLERRVPLLHEISDKDGSSNMTITDSQATVQLICRQHDNCELVFFGFGIYPIASFQVADSLHGLYLYQSICNERDTQLSQSVVKSSSSRCGGNECVLITSSTDSSFNNSSSSTTTAFRDVLTCQPSLSEILTKLEHLASIQLLLNQYSKRIDEHVNNMSKKWKECIKTIPLKLSLLKTLIEGYQLNMSTVEFLHTVAVCGMWHPAASTSFSQHWNEQGITRLRSGIDATSRFIIRTLQLKVAPLATNISVLTKMQQSAVSDILFLENHGGIKLSSDWHTDIFCMEPANHLVFAVDDAIMEAKRAREAFLVFLQFLKDGLLETSTNSISDQGLFIRKQCAKLFQRTRKRLDFSNPEHITGTFLSNHLQKITGTALEFTHKPPSEIKNLMSALDSSTNLFSQKPLFEQSKTFRDCFEKSMARSCPLFNPTSLNLGTQLVTGSMTLAAHSMVNNMKLEILIDGEDEHKVVSHSIISSYVLKSSKSGSRSVGAEVLIEVIDLQQYTKYYARVQVPCKGATEKVKTIVYIRKGSDTDVSNCSILLLVGRETVSLYRISLTDQAFVPADELLTTGDVPAAAYGGTTETYDFDNLSIFEANGSRGVLFLSDSKGKVLVIDLENEEDGEDEEDGVAEDSTDEC